MRVSQSVGVYSSFRPYSGFIRPETTYHVSYIQKKKKQSLCFTPSIASRKNIILVCIQKYLTSIFSACNFTLFTLATETPTTYLNSSREKEKFGSQRMLILSRAIQVGHKKKNPKQTQAGKQIPTAKP